jgi:MFS family permease
MSLLATGVGSAFAALHPSLVVQVVLAGWLGACAAIAQPSFDAITQRHVPAGAQGRTFARFAVRQQLLWVVGALIPVGISMHFRTGDVSLAVLTLGAGLVYGIGRRFSRQ